MTIDKRACFGYDMSMFRMRVFLFQQDRQPLTVILAPEHRKVEKVGGCLFN